MVPTSVVEVNINRVVSLRRQVREGDLIFLTDFDLSVLSFRLPIDRFSLSHNGFKPWIHCAFQSSHVVDHRHVCHCDFKSSSGPGLGSYFESANGRLLQVCTTNVEVDSLCGELVGAFIGSLQLQLQCGVFLVAC